MLLSANLQPEGHEQLQILNLQESTKKKSGGEKEDRKKNKIKTPLRRNHDTTGIKTIPGLQLKGNNNRKNGPGDE